jgi:Uma2 family endonuclease
MELLIEEEKYTVEDFRKMENDLDGGYFYEVIDGQIVKREPAHLNKESLYHKVERKIYVALMKYTIMRRIGDVFSSPHDVFFDDINLYQPDIFFIYKDKIESSLKGFDIVKPDLVVEVLSPENGKYIRGIKKQMYELDGVQEYWIVDLANRIIEVYVLENKRFTLHSYNLEKEKIVSKLFKELDLSGEEIFG